MRVAGFTLTPCHSTIHHKVLGYHWVSFCDLKFYTAVNPSLRYQAARHALGMLNADDMKATIKALCDEGIYLDVFIDALDSGLHPQMEHVLPAFIAALQYSDVAVPSRDEAVWQLIEYHLNRVVSNQDRAWQELERLVTEVNREYDFHTPTRQYLGDSHGIELLLGLCWSADDIRERPNEVTVNGLFGDAAWVELNRLIVVEATRWLCDRAAKPSIEQVVYGLSPSLASKFNP